MIIILESTVDFILRILSVRLSVVANFAASATVAAAMGNCSFNIYQVWIMNVVAATNTGKAS